MQHLKSSFALLAAGMLSTPGLGQQYDVSIDTSAIQGTSGALVWDLVSDASVSNTAFIINFQHDGVTGLPVTQGGLISGDIILLSNPAANTTMQDDSFLNELLLPFESFGTSVEFTLQLTANASPGVLADQFSFFVLDTTGQPLLTSDALDADSFFSVCIDGSPGGMLSVHDPAVLTGADQVSIVMPSWTPREYCTAKINSVGCVPEIDFTGDATVTGPDDFIVSASNVLNRKFGLMILSTTAANIPFRGGTLCLKTPILRFPPQSSGGSDQGLDCSGTYSCPVAQSELGTLGIGTSVFVQYYSRDPGFDRGERVGLTGGLKFIVSP